MLSVPSPSGERREGVNASVSSDVQSVFKGKTYSQLQVIFQGIEGKIRAGGPNLDMGYWESLLQQLRAHMARARSVLPPASVGPRSRPRGASAHCPSWKAVPLGSGVRVRGGGQGLCGPGLQPHLAFVSPGSAGISAGPEAACPPSPAHPTPSVYKFSACLAAPHKHSAWLSLTAELPLSSLVPCWRLAPCPARLGG